MKKLLACLSILLLASCVEEAKETKQIGNFKVEFLFEQDGCKMYRFKDGSRYIYWSNCEGRVQSNYNSGGKNGHVIRQETITTK